MEIVNVGCPFCERITAGDYDCYEPPGTPPSVVWFEPLNPVTEGHMLFVPAEHVTGWTTLSRVTAITAVTAARWTRDRPGYESADLITSAGAPATQTVFHLHLHVIPRRPGDGLRLPWTGRGDHRPEWSRLPRDASDTDLALRPGLRERLRRALTPREGRP